MRVSLFRERKDSIRLEADGGGNTWAIEHVYNGYSARAAVKPQCLMRPGVTMRADIMHPHRRRVDACHLSAPIPERIATVSPSLLPPPPSPSRPTEKCVRTCSVKKDEELDRLDSHRWRRRTKRGRNALNEDALHDALIYRIFFFFFTIHSKRFIDFRKMSLFTSIHNYSPGIWNNCKVELIKE